MKQVAKLCTSAVLVAVSAAAIAAVEWPSDFDAKLAAHVAAEMSTNTTSAVASIGEVEPCVRTVAVFDFSVKRSPPPKPGFILVVR